MRDITNFNQESADAFMRKMSDSIKDFDQPCCICISIGDDKFYAENDAMESATLGEKNDTYAGMNVAMVSGLLTPEDAGH